MQTSLEMIGRWLKSMTKRLALCACVIIISVFMLMSLDMMPVFVKSRDLYSDDILLAKLSSQITEENAKQEKHKDGTVKRFIEHCYRPGDQMTKSFRGCPGRCEFTTNVDEADVVLFNGEFMTYKNCKLPRRTRDQIWMMHTREPPTKDHFSALKRPDLRNAFNWTRTVLPWSTFPVYHGEIVLNEDPQPTIDYKKLYKSKVHDVAWFVSQCDRQSRRLEYVTAMQHDVPVHIYGRCGNYTCGAPGHDSGGDDCLAMLSQKYKFYLSFENSFCKGYMTEKVFNMYLNDIDVIPVVRGAGDYKLKLPAGTYVNAADFSSSSELARHLKRLGQDEAAYTRMLREKRRFKSVKIGFPACDICAAAHSRSPEGVIEDISDWFSAERHCHAPTDLPSQS